MMIAAGGGEEGGKRSGERRGELGLGSFSAAAPELEIKTTTPA